MNFRPGKQYAEKLRAEVKNEHEAFRALYDQYWSKLYLYAFNVLQDKMICEDIIQEVFVSFWQKSDALAIDNLSAYLFQAVKFQIFKHLRNGKITQRHLDQITFLQNHNDTEEQLNAQELEKELSQLIDRLPERCQQIFRLSRFEHLSNQEIAQQLGLSIQTVNNQISKAHAFLRKEISAKASFILLLFFLQ